MQTYHLPLYVCIFSSVVYSFLSMYDFIKKSPFTPSSLLPPLHKRGRERDKNARLAFLSSLPRNFLL
ncbi:hypothetical protein CSUI_011103, partial [Cystoisospora suis]